MIRGIILALMLLPAPAWAHSWYPAGCCADRDCAPLPPGGVEKVEGGWLIKETGEIIPPDDAKEADDGQYHRCRWNADQPLSLTRPGCFWVPNQTGY